MISALKEYRGRRPDLKLPDGRKVDDIRRAELFRELDALGVPDIDAHHGKFELVAAYAAYFEQRQTAFLEEYKDTWLPGGKGAADG